MIYNTKRLPKLIVVDADGDIITAANGQISSDNRELIQIIKREVSLGTRTQLIPPFGSLIRASLDPDDLIGLTAALFSARPGRTKLLEAPAEVWRLLEVEIESSEGESFGEAFTEEESRAKFESAGIAHEAEAVRLLLGLGEEKIEGDN